MIYHYAQNFSSDFEEEENVEEYRDKVMTLIIHGINAGILCSVNHISEIFRKQFTLVEEDPGASRYHLPKDDFQLFFKPLKEKCPAEFKNLDLRDQLFGLAKRDLCSGNTPLSELYYLDYIDLDARRQKRLEKLKHVGKKIWERTRELEKSTNPRYDTILNEWKKSCKEI